MTETALLLLIAVVPGAVASTVSALGPTITKWLEGRQAEAKEIREYQRRKVEAEYSAAQNFRREAVAVLLWFQETTGVNKLESRKNTINRTLCGMAGGDQRMYRKAVQVHEHANDLFRDALIRESASAEYDQPSPDDPFDHAADAARIGMRQGGLLDQFRRALAELERLIDAQNVARNLNGGLPVRAWWPRRAVNRWWDWWRARRLAHGTTKELERRLARRVDLQAADAEVSDG